MSRSDTHTRWLRSSDQNILPRSICSAAPRAFRRNAESTFSGRVCPAGAEWSCQTADPDVILEVISVKRDGSDEEKLYFIGRTMGVKKHKIPLMLFARGSCSKSGVKLADAPKTRAEGYGQMFISRYF